MQKKKKKRFTPDIRSHLTWERIVDYFVVWYAIMLRKKTFL